MATKAKTKKSRFKGASPRRPGENDMDYLKRLTKAANERMNQLEKLSKRDPDYKNVLKWSYKGAVADIQRLEGKENEPWRFGTKKGDVKNIQSRINAVSRFLNSPTSTITGIKEIYQNRADTINTKYGTDFSWSDIGNFWQSETARKMLEEYDSDTVMTAVAEMSKVPVKDIANAVKKNLQISDDEVLSDEIKQILNDYNLKDVGFIFKGNDRQISRALGIINKNKKKGK